MGIQTYYTGWVVIKKPDAAWRRLVANVGTIRVRFPCHVTPMTVRHRPYVSDLFHRNALSSLSSQIRVANKLSLSENTERPSLTLPSLPSLP